MIEKIGKQENLPENMGIIPILKMKKVIFFRLSLFSHAKSSTGEGPPTDTSLNCTPPPAKILQCPVHQKL